MARTVEFVVVLEEGVRKRHYHQSEKGKVISFMVQLEVCVDGDWKPVVRYDSAHGFAHMDRFDSEGNQKKIPIELSFDSALAYGDWDINVNWAKYVKTFRKQRTKP